MQPYRMSGHRAKLDRLLQTNSNTPPKPTPEGHGFSRTNNPTPPPPDPERGPSQRGLARDRRPVIDRTSLTGRYDFTLRWTYDLSQESESGAPPSLFTAIKEQLGLRVDAVKGPAEVFVIDHVERPSQN
jgi:hypothetical protein